MTPEITSSTAYEALGLAPEEAAVRAVRVLIAAEIERFVRRRRMTQTAAAAFFGVSQPRISNIINGKLQGLSIDLLVKLVSKTGRLPSVTFRRPGAGQGPAQECRTSS